MKESIEPLSLDDQVTQIIGVDSGEVVPVRNFVEDEASYRANENCMHIYVKRTALFTNEEMSRIYRCLDNECHAFIPLRPFEQMQKYEPVMASGVKGSYFVRRDIVSGGDAA